MQNKFYGKLSPEQLADLDALILKLRDANVANLSRRKISKADIIPLPDDEYVRLWEYLKHCCKLVTSWKNVRDAIKVVADKSGRQIEDVQDECVLSMTIFVYTYVWRHYVHSDECGYVFSTAKFGYKVWLQEQNAYHLGVESVIEDYALEHPSCGKKVFTQNVN